MLETMRTQALTLAAAVVALAACGSDDGPGDDASTAAKGSASDVARATGCAKEVTVLLWPDGHPAVPGVSFPSLPMPHVEIYRGTDPGYPMSDAIAWAFASPPGPSFPQRSTTPACLSSTSTAELGEVDDAVSVRDPVRLVCRMPDGAQIVNSESGKNRFAFAVAGPEGGIVVEGTVSAQHSELDYARASCERSDPPMP
jgi:hypothetical protein